MAQGARQDRGLIGAALLALVIVLVAGCRTRPVDGPDDHDGSVAPPMSDLASPTATFDLGGCGGDHPCAAGELCIFVNRGDCSRFICARIPPACGADTSCDCTGAMICDGLRQGGETLTCLAPPMTMTPGIECRSSIQCI